MILVSHRRFIVIIWVSVTAASLSLGSFTSFVTGSDLHPHKGAAQGAASGLCTRSSQAQDGDYGAFSLLWLISTDLARCASYNTLPCHSLGVSQRSLDSVYKAEISLCHQEAPQVQTAPSELYETPSHCDTVQHCNIFDVPNLKY